MIKNLHELYGNTLVARDGDIGKVKDTYFDDQTWVVRYLVADTGSWLTGRLVLLSPHALGELDVDAKTQEVKLTRQQIENSPPIESHQPVSRQYEIDYHHYYGWPTYWTGDALWGLGGFPVAAPAPLDPGVARPRRHHHRADKHLRSAQAVIGYSIQATDGEIGSVRGFTVDDQSWAISELEVETGHWYSGKEILIATDKVARISYQDAKVFVNLTTADIRRTAEDELAKAGD